MRGGREKANFRKKIVDIERCQGVQHFRFNTGSECFKYSVCITGHKTSKMNGISKTHLDNLRFNGGGERAKFPKVDFNFLKGHYPITLKGVDMFEKANVHLKIGVSVLKYDIEYEEGNLKIKLTFYI